jgi:hypothetical protein
MDHGKAVAAFARGGLSAKGVTYMLIAALAFGAALGSGRAGDSTQALRSIQDAPFGRILLVVIGAGLLAYALWRWYSGIANPEDHKPPTRAMYVFTGIVNFAVAAEALRMGLSNRGGDAGNQAPHWTAEAMSKPMGVWLIAAAGIGVAAYGGAQLIRALRSKLDKHLRLGELDGRSRVWVRRISRIGIAARGLVFMIMGWFLSKAALEHDPSEARDLGAALRALQEQPYGKWLLGGVAVGLFLYGCYNLVRARYRVVGT